MSADFLQNLISANMPDLMWRTINGSCRFLSAADLTATDEQGFINSGFEARTDDFINCSWSPKTNDKNTSSEQLIANQSRAAFVYEITVTKTENGAAVICHPSDRLEIKFKPDSDEVQILEIVSIVNQMHVAWLVYAIDIETSDSE